MGAVEPSALQDNLDAWIGDHCIAAGAVPGVLFANRRSDEWGGSPEARDRFAIEVVRRTREALPRELAVTMKIGLVDASDADERLTLEESVRRAARLVPAGLDAVEVSCNVMRLPTDSARRYVAVDRRRAVRDLLLHRVLASPEPDGSGHSRAS